MLYKKITGTSKVFERFSLRYRYRTERDSGKKSDPDPDLRTRIRNTGKQVVILTKPLQCKNQCCGAERAHINIIQFIFIFTVLYFSVECEEHQAGWGFL